MEMRSGPKVSGRSRRVAADKGWSLRGVPLYEFPRFQTERLNLPSDLVSLARLSHSQERVWYVTVQLIVLADSGCSVYTRSSSTQTTYTFGGKHPTKVVGSGTNHCIVKYQTLS